MREKITLFAVTLTIRINNIGLMVDGLMCYAGWDKFKGNCYRRSPSGPATYSAAQAACKGLQANLLIIENQEEMDYLAGEHYSGIEKTTSSRMYSTGAMLCL